MLDWSQLWDSRGSERCTAELYRRVLKTENAETEDVVPSLSLVHGKAVPMQGYSHDNRGHGQSWAKLVWITRSGYCCNDDIASACEVRDTKGHKQSSTRSAWEATRTIRSGMATLSKKMLRNSQRNVHEKGVKRGRRTWSMPRPGTIEL